MRELGTGRPVSNTVAFCYWPRQVRPSVRRGVAPLSCLVDYRPAGQRALVMTAPGVLLTCEERKVAAHCVEGPLILSLDLWLGVWCVCRNALAHS